MQLIVQKTGPTDK